MQKHHRSGEHSASPPPQAPSPAAHRPFAHEDSKKSRSRSGYLLTSKGKDAPNNGTSVAEPELHGAVL